MENQINFEEQKKPVQTMKDFDLDDFSDVAVGDNQKYNRPNLDKKTVKIVSASVSPASDADEVITAVSNPASKYKKARFKVTFDSKNSEGMADREFYSGAIQFVQKDGSLSPPKFWRKDGASQVANLWNLVAQYKKIKPEEMSPKMFLSVLNSGIQVTLQSETIKFQGKSTQKNIISKIVG